MNDYVVRWTQHVLCASKHALVVVEDEIRVACTSCGGRAAANAHLPWGTTAAAAPAAPGTSGTAAPASAPTGPPPAAPPPPEKRESMPGISDQKQPKHAKITPSASGYRIAVPPSKYHAPQIRNAWYATTGDWLIAKQAWLILPWAGPGACRASGGHAGGGQQRAAACRRGSLAGRPGA